MYPIEPNILDQYAHSGWALWSSIFILIGLLLYTSDRYAKRWSAITGLHQTDARVVFSEVCIDGRARKQALVIYTYTVNGKHFKGHLAQPKTNLQAFIEKHPVGTEIPVSYTHLTLPTTPYV